MLSSKPNQDQIKILSTTNFMFKNFYSTFYRGCMNYLLKFVLNLVGNHKIKVWVNWRDIKEK